MTSLNRKNLKKLILKEIQKMMDEEALMRRNDYKDYGMLNKHDDPGRQMMYMSCSECGAKMYEGESSCSECGSMYESSLYEGNCGGCGSCGSCGGGTDYSTSSMGIIDHALESLTQSGYNVKASKKSKDYKVGNHKVYKGSYMAKNHLYKVNKYSEKLYHMIPDGHNLEDWMRSKLAQIADDISEVYHALDHDKFEGDI